MRITAKLFVSGAALLAVAAFAALTHRKFIDHIEFGLHHRHDHQLRDALAAATDECPGPRIIIVVESFGFKHGIPGDADFVFDARSIPNPYWEPTLRKLTGRDADVVKFLESQEAAGRLIEDIVALVEPTEDIRPP